MRFRLATLALAGLITVPIALHSQDAQTKTKQDKPKKAQQNQNNKQPAAVRLVPAAKKFLASLTDDQRVKAALKFETEQRVQWHFIPMKSRKGLPLMEMEPSQKKIAMQLLQAAVSKVGYNKASIIMQLESVLKQLEAGRGSNERNPEKYYFTVFGTPGPGEHWGLSIEGHHLSLNFVLQGNRIVDSTPQFFASNPAKLKASYGENFPAGLQVLAAEEQLGFKLVKSLSDEQLAEAMLPGETPSEIRGAGEPQPPTKELGGIPAANLNEQQQANLKKLMQAYTNKMKPLVSKERWKLIDEAGFNEIKFAWSGAKKPGVGHYYVVQGPTFVIEFINVQPDAAGNPANHVHCVWRDMQGDFDLPIK